ncbi:MAG: dCTP deaminase [Haloferacaceae archaeon]
MILSDGDIRSRLAEGDLVIEPIEDPDLQIQPASVDLRLGREFLEFERTNIPCIHPGRSDEVDEYVTKTTVPLGPTGDGGTLDGHDGSDAGDADQHFEDEEFILHPGDFVLGTTIERVELPADLIAHVEGRSSLGRLAIVVHATAGIVDPGYRGQITLELSNLGSAPVALTPGMRISQLTFTELSSPAERPYGEERGSKYQNQSGPQASRIQRDHEFHGTQK